MQDLPQLRVLRDLLARAKSQVDAVPSQWAVFHPERPTDGVQVETSNHWYNLPVEDQLCITPPGAFVLVRHGLGMYSIWVLVSAGETGLHWTSCQKIPEECLESAAISLLVARDFFAARGACLAFSPIKFSQWYDAWIARTPHG